MNSEIVKGSFSLEVYKGGSVSTLETNEVSISHQESSDLWFVGAHFGEPGVKGPIIALSFMKSHKAGEYEIAPGPSETVTSASMGEGTIGGGGFHEQGTGEMTLNEITSVEPNLFSVSGNCWFEFKEYGSPGKTRIVVKEFSAKIIEK